jgi:cytochrome c-type biogenesis protein CcmH
MTALTYVIFALIALAAAAFVVWPVVARLAGRARYILAAAAVLFVLGAGGALYLYLGHPFLAVRTLQGKNDKSPNALIGRLAAALRKHPGNPRDWVMLGEAYYAARDPQDSANAFARAIEAARAQGRSYSFLYAAYGESLTQASAGAVTPEAEAAFNQALALDPKDAPSRYYLGLAEAARGNAPMALRYWNDLLADLPANSPVRAELVDRIAALTARSGGAAPNVADMVAGLAARLKADPNDALGWEKLIHAYAVLGDGAKARAALSDARKAFAGQASPLAAFDAEQKSLGL